jgi:DNA polymerase/3'-5' exonuclease PolX
MGKDARKSKRVRARKADQAPQTPAFYRVVEWLDGAFGLLARRNGGGMKYEDMLSIATRLKDRLAPFCDRIEIAGSIRRKKPDCGDVELVCIPKRVQAGLFDEDMITDPGFAKEVEKLPAVKGSPQGKYTQRTITFDRKEVKIDIFMTRHSIWGSIFAIRTGSADFAHYSLAKRWLRQGWNSEEGVLVHAQSKERMAFEEEDELFAFLGLPFIQPEDRDAKGEEDKRIYYGGKEPDPF